MTYLEREIEETLGSRICLMLDPQKGDKKGYCKAVCDGAILPYWWMSKNRRGISQATYLVTCDACKTIIPGDL